MALPIGFFTVFVDEPAEGHTEITAYGHRGDLLVDPTGVCAARYGAVFDRDSHEYVVGTRVSVYRFGSISGSGVGDRAHMISRRNCSTRDRGSPVASRSEITATD